MGDRERLSQRLHREVIHELFAIGLNLQALALQAIDDAERRRLEDAVTSTDRAIDALRKAIFGVIDPGPQTGRRIQLKP
jgi:signal transduction histidine kinase